MRDLVRGLGNLIEEKGETYDRSTLKDTANDPDPTGENDSLFTAKQVCEFCDCESTDEGTSGHGSDDGALGAGARVTESVLVGVVLLWARWAAVRKWKWRWGKERFTYAQDTGHGRDVQTEETTTDTCKGTYDVLEKERSV